MHATTPARRRERSIITAFSIAAALAACDASAPQATSTLASLDVDGPVLAPNETQVFHGLVKPWSSDETFPIEELRLAIHENGADRTVELRRGEAIEGPVLVTADGRVPSTSLEIGIGSDVLAPLPAAGARLTVGQSYESPAPPFGYVLANHETGKLTMSQRVISTPVAIERYAFGTLVRLKTRTFNQLSAIVSEIDPAVATPNVRTFDLGLAYVGVTDLLHVEGAGWRVLRFARWSPVEEVDRDISLEALRELPHHVFSACVVESSLVSEILDAAHAARTELPELRNCR